MYVSDLRPAYTMIRLCVSVSRPESMLIAYVRKSLSVWNDSLSYRKGKYSQAMHGSVESLSITMKYTSCTVHLSGADSEGVGWGVGLSRTPLILKISFSWESLDNLINLGHLSLHFSSTSPFYYL